MWYIVVRVQRKNTLYKRPFTAARDTCAYRCGVILVSSHIAAREKPNGGGNRKTGCLPPTKRTFAGPRTLYTSRQSAADEATTTATIL